jgi:hypothetical protein
MVGVGAGGEHGNDVWNMANYFSVGSRNKLCLGVATYLAGFEQVRGNWGVR